MCLSFIGYEGSEAREAPAQAGRRDRRSPRRDLRRVGPGELYDQKKFDTPYIRDFLLDRGGIADVSETSAPWSELATLYAACRRPRRARRSREIGVEGWVMCHLSHSYHSGACLYFTFAFKASGRREALEQYDAVKTAIQQAFMDWARRCRTTTPSASSTRVARAGHLPGRRGDGARRCSTASTRATTSTRARSSTRGLQRARRFRAHHGDVNLDGPSRRVVAEAVDTVHAPPEPVRAEPGPPPEPVREPRPAPRA